MSLLYSQKTRTRREFGHATQFKDGKARILKSIDAQGEDCEEAQQWVKKRYSTIEIDCTPEYAQHEADTGNLVQKPSGTLFVNGAWPKKVKGGEITERQRYLQRLTAEKEYFKEVPAICDIAHNSVAQNNTLDLYEQYFKDGDIYESDDATMKLDTICVLKDPSEEKRHATSVCWHPDGSGKIAVSYSIMKFQKMSEATPVQSYIWDINHPNAPEFEIIPNSPLTCLQFNPKTHDHLAGGMYNGTIGFWDIRNKTDRARPSAVSNIKFSHRDPVFDLRYVSSRSSTELVSVSTDGRLLWWDTRKLEKPIDEFVLQNEEKEILGISGLEYKSESGPTKYLVATEKGFPVVVERKAKKDQPSEKKIKAMFNQGHSGHYSAARAVKRNPVETSNFLTCGDWCVKIWSEENLKSPIMISAYDKNYLTSACWSTIRPGVFFTGKSDGTMDIWDIYSKQSEAVLSVKISETPITNMCVHKHGKMMAVGSEDGVTSIMSLGKGLSTVQRMEREVVTEIFEREKKRETLLDKMRKLQEKQREKELKQKSKAASAKPKEEKVDPKEEAKKAALAKADAHWKTMMEKLTAKPETKT
uniref:Guanine nucleotide-binding protein subunit beta-like protein n=1 Tax=Lotharella globosa TaxID=91324 RepID=A0A7S4DT78_9EUKA|mmetsp:Transcript_5877/g.11663  ORF Transcript_5877/g.11663 Transcript_5877/m.11663 type:complete len:586 (+) Transcript_5877:58-1815(+)|eukprot:CAMPEP_0167820252 /NCGR_PEP_ID=MMETSP0112_2-20121227/5967_1 /TAXON_ID=91324 /ORGANISM="Lotharella globosa, Strain CCCM811" /LENGTH=585 /DNA_ID=CAMNT_0007720747 /DNA_START=51 /DNA_END=1808 /DNA_ORIENTATION=-